MILVATPEEVAFRCWIVRATNAAIAFYRYELYRRSHALLAWRVPVRQHTIERGRGYLGWE